MSPLLRLLMLLLAAAELVLPSPITALSETGTDLSSVNHLVGSAGHHAAAAAVPRFLQSSGTNTSTDNGGTADPTIICESLNSQLKGEMTCTCERYGKRAVSVSCNAVVDTCNKDNTYCVRLSTQYYTDDKGVPISMTSCTNLTTPGLSAKDKADTCVQVFPSEAGNFTTVTKCYATLNDQSCSCSVCDATSAAASRASSSGASVSINCCRILDGAQATCLPVIPSGPVAVQFDQLTDKQQCKATSGGATTITRWPAMTGLGFGSTVTSLAVLLAGTQLLFATANLL